MGVAVKEDMTRKEVVTEFTEKWKEGERKNQCE